MARQLKVFSTPAGFFNAVVAAPSQRAALEAWGLRENVFANGTATVVTDPELIARALATPGAIVRVPIGTEAAILAGVKRPPKAAAALATRPTPKPTIAPPPTPQPKPPPPDRSALDAAEMALAAAEQRKVGDFDRLAAELRRFEDEQRQVKAVLDREVASATASRDAAAKRYHAAGGA